MGAWVVIYVISSFILVAELSDKIIKARELSEQTLKLPELVSKKSLKLYGANYQVILDKASKVALEATEANPACDKITLVNMNYYKSTQHKLLIETLCMNSGIQGLPRRWTFEFTQDKDSEWINTFIVDWAKAEYHITNYGG